MEQDFRDINKEGEDIQRRIQELDVRDDESGHEEDEREERRLFLTEQRRNTQRQEMQEVVKEKIKEFFK